MELLAIFILRGNGSNRVDFDIRYNENILDIMGRYALHHKRNDVLPAGKETVLMTGHP